MSTLHRQRVVRADGRAINVVQRRAHLSYCFSGCCCGRTERGYAAVPADTFKDEWLKRKLRNVVHLTKAGCLGPCALANVASLVFDGRAIWFHSVNTAWHVRLIYDYIETMVRADRYVAPPSELTEYVFNYYDWDVRPKAAGLPAPVTRRLHGSRAHRAVVARGYRPARAASCAAVAACRRGRARDLVDAAADRGAAVVVARRRSRACPRRHRPPARRDRGRARLFTAARMGAATGRPSGRRQRNGGAAAGLRGRGHGQPRRRGGRASLPDDGRRAQRRRVREVPCPTGCCSQAMAANRRSRFPNMASTFATSSTRRSTTGTSARIRRGRRRQCCSIAHI